MTLYDCCADFRLFKSGHWMHKARLDTDHIASPSLVHKNISNTQHQLHLIAILDALPAHFALNIHQAQHYPACVYLFLSSSISRWNFSISSRMLFESFLLSVPALASVSSASSLGEYSAYSLALLSSAGAYSCRRECSLAPLARLLSRLVRRRSVLVRRCSVLVLRLSVGLNDEMSGRCWSRLERPEPGLRRGGGGGGGIPAPLSLDARRRLLRFEAVEAVRERGTSGSASSVLLREDGPRDEPVVRTEVDRWGSSVEDELVDEPISERRAPCLDGGGGGGAFELGVVVALLATSPGVGVTPVDGTSRECCDDNVNDELLLDLVSADDCRS